MAPAQQAPQPSAPRPLRRDDSINGYVRARTRLGDNFRVPGVPESDAAGSDEGSSPPSGAGDSPVLLRTVRFAECGSPRRAASAEEPLQGSLRPRETDGSPAVKGQPHAEYPSEVHEEGEEQEQVTDQEQDGEDEAGAAKSAGTSSSCGAPAPAKNASRTGKPLPEDGGHAAGRSLSRRRRRRWREEATKTTSMLLRGIGGETLLETFRSSRNGAAEVGSPEDDGADVRIEDEDEGLASDTRKSRKTCGFRLEASLQVCLTVPAVFLVLATAVLIAVPTLVTSSASIDKLETASSDAIMHLSSFAQVATRNLTAVLTHDTLDNVKLLVRQNNLDLAMRAVGSVVNAIASSSLIVRGLAPAETAEQYYGQPSFQAPGSSSELRLSKRQLEGSEQLMQGTNATGWPLSGWAMSVAPFLLGQVLSGRFDTLTRVYVGWATNEFAGAYLHRQLADTNNSQTVTSVTFAQAVPSLDAEGQLHPAMVHQFELDETFAPTWEHPSDGVLLNVTSRAWYAVHDEIQRSDPDTPAGGIWSDLYLFNSGQEIGLTYSYPLTLCRRYSCMAGVIAADLETTSMSEYCANNLRQVVESTLEQTNSPASIEEIMDSSALFVVQNSPESTKLGVLVASSWPGNETSNREIGADFVVAVNSSNRIVRDAASRVNELLPFGDIEKWTALADPLPWTWTSKDDQLISAVRLISANLLGGTSVKPLELAVILSLPVRLFAGAIDGQLEQVEDSVNGSVQAARDTAERSHVTIIAVVVAGCVLATMTAMIAGCALTARFQELERSMLEIRSLQFGRGEPEFHSRIKEIHHMQETFAAVKNTLRVFGKFVPHSVVQGIVRNEPNARVLNVKQREVTILFSDVANFTAISELLSERELLYFLTKYLTVMTYVVESYGGVVGEVLGDGILAFWNTPDDVPDHAALACASALAQQECVRDLGEEFRDIFLRRGFAGSLSIRIGINTGRVLTGNIGSRDKMKFGCIGDSVNAASRLEELCKRYEVGIICSDRTASVLPADCFELRELDRVRVKGRQEPTTLFEVIRLAEKLPNSAAIASLAGQSRDANCETKSGRSMQCCNSARCSCLPSRKHGPSHGDGDMERSLSATAMKMARSAHFGPLGPPPSPGRLEDHAAFAAALHAYQAGDFQAAFDELGNIIRRDKPVALLRERIDQAFLAYGSSLDRDTDMGASVTPDGEAWDGTLNLLEKRF